MTRHTGGYRSNGSRHTQPRALRRWWCHLTGGHRCKMGAHPSGSCIRCGWWPPGYQGGTR